jgi:hypothetical protein
LTWAKVRSVGQFHFMQSYKGKRVYLFHARIRRGREQACVSRVSSDCAIRFIGPYRLKQTQSLGNGIR